MGQPDARPAALADAAGCFLEPAHHGMGGIEAGDAAGAVPEREHHMISVEHDDSQVSRNASR